jgi:fatty acid desaturase
LAGNFSSEVGWFSFPASQNLASNLPSETRRRRTIMNELQTEIAELKEFIAELKADRAATREKEKRESWTKYVTLSVGIIAVIAAICLVTKKKPLWFAALILAGIAATQMVMAWLA